MKILRDLWYNIATAALGAIFVALVQLIVWGENIREGATAWFLVFFIAFTAGDIIKWAYNKIRGK